MKEPEELESMRKIDAIMRFSNKELRLTKESMGAMPKLFGNVVMKSRTETELIAYCQGGTEVNLVTALGFYSMFGSL